MAPVAGVEDASTERLLRTHFLLLSVEMLVASIMGGQMNVGHSLSAIDRLNRALSDLLIDWERFGELE